jgi:ribosomal-protein-alanine N-acetyltransferase
LKIEDGVFVEFTIFNLQFSIFNFSAFCAMAQPAERAKPAPALEIVPMSCAHIEDVLGIEREAFPNPWRRGDFEYALGRPNGYAVVAFRSSLIAAYAVGFFVRTEFHLASLAVRRGLRGRGLGGAVLSRVIEAAQGRGARVATLEVRASNAPAISLYEGAGFRQIAVREGYYTRPSEDALVMMKGLQDAPWP